jgi:hypothetical protein
MLSLQSLHPATIIVNEDGLAMWKEMLPAYAERCRQWDHFPICEYNAQGTIPLSPESDQFLCSCGNGKLPPNFIPRVPGWETASKHMIRAAISPMFSVAFVEPLLHAKG